MKQYISDMPAWAIILYIVGFFLSLVVLARPFKQAALNAGLPIEKARRVQAGIIFFYLLWLGYISVLSLKGVFFPNTLPPRILVYATLPLTILLLAFVGNTGLFKKLLRSATLESLIAMHVFRLVGVFFIILYFYKLLPPEFGISAGLGDLITAIFAIPVARAVAQKKSWSIKAAYAWNIFGLLDIATLMTIAVLGAIKGVGAGEQGGGEMTIFPFVWFPAFAPATITFLHVAIFRKLRDPQLTVPGKH